MNNEIKSLHPMEPRRNGAVQGVAPAGKQVEAGREAAARGPAEDKVTLTEAARTITSMSAELAREGTFDGAKVTQLRAAIESGRYQADPVAIADALMRFDQQG